MQAHHTSIQILVDGKQVNMDIKAVVHIEMAETRNAVKLTLDKDVRIKFHTVTIVANVVRGKVVQQLVKDTHVQKHVIQAEQMLQNVEHIKNVKQLGKDIGAQQVLAIIM